MSRFLFLCLAIFTFAVPAFSVEPPNILLLMGDDHGWDETGYNGHPYLKTPVMDEMAKTGLRLDRFYAAHPSCSPTRASFLTGRHPNRCGTYAPGWTIRPQEITLANILTEAEYYTSHIGKWHLGPVKEGSPTNPGAMGFDEWFSHDNFFELDPVMSRNGGPPEKVEGESSEIMVEETMRFIQRAREKGKPFGAVVWFGSPHEPYSGLEKDLALYDDLPEELAKTEVKLTSNETGDQVKRPLRDVLRERYAEITAMDRAIGMLRDFLKKEGLRENTLLFYCGDNGVPTSGVAAMTLRGHKATMYEGGIRVPGLIEWPAGIPQPMTSGVNAVTSDLLPTVCELVGQPLPNRPLDGLSLVPLMNGRMKQRENPICFWSYDIARLRNMKPESLFPPEDLIGTTPLVKKLNGKFTRSFENYVQPEITEEDYEGPRAILDNRYKLVVDEAGEGESELFDMRGDPGESKNLTDANPETANALATELRYWQESVMRSASGVDY